MYVDNTTMIWEKSRIWRIISISQRKHYLKAIGGTSGGTSNCEIRKPNPDI